MNALEFDRDVFMEQGFQFTKSGNSWMVSVLESWTSEGETWRFIGHTMGREDRWAAINFCRTTIGHKSRLEAAQHLERLYYGK